ncbi:MAG: metal ABC transporter substrate-binding protein [Anaerolineales bacterium]|nr:metal ABC transporter substrate-binding protein [Anaerolineales bacterium]
MKKIINSIIVLTTTAALFLTACGSTPSSDSAAVTTSINVLASTSFLADIAQNVAGDRLTVASLLPFGADPHAYQAAPTDVAKIAESNLLILNGVEYEHFIEPLLENAGGERLIVEATKGLEVNQMAEEAGHEGEEDHSPEGHPTSEEELKKKGGRANTKVFWLPVVRTLGKDCAGMTQRATLTEHRIYPRSAQGRRSRSRS